MRLLAALLASAALFAGCTGAWWVYGPVWEVQAQLKRAEGLRRAELSRVSYNRETRTACGYVRGARGTVGWTHFVLPADGKLSLEPDTAPTGSTLQQLEALRRQTDYLALVYARCAA